MASNNSSKTAHVMNLLSKNRGAGAEPPADPKTDPASPAEAAAPQQPEASAAPAAPQVAPLISSINADAAVSSQIKDALEAELEGAAPVSKPPVRQAAPAPQAAPPREAPASPVQAAPPREAPAAPVQAAPAQEAPAAPVQAAPAPQAPAPEAEKPAYLNVMQVLVEEKADEYMKMFGICCCDKCRVDVRAYALNHLPPKYVVLSENERVPRLTVYESRFSSDITAQLIQACKKVMLTPHHSRPDT